MPAFVAAGIVFDLFYSISYLTDALLVMILTVFFLTIVSNGGMFVYIYYESQSKSLSYYIMGLKLQSTKSSAILN